MYQCIVWLLRGKQRGNPFPPTLPPLPLCLKWKTLMKRTRIILKMVMAVGSICLGGLPVLACSIITHADRDGHIQTNTHTQLPRAARPSLQQWWEKGAQLIPLYRLSQSETVPQVRWSDFCHFGLVSKDLTLAHKHAQGDAVALCIQLIQCLCVDLASLSHFIWCCTSSSTLADG